MRKQIRKIETVKAVIKESGQVWQWYVDGSFTRYADRRSDSLMYGVVKRMIDAGELVHVAKLRNDVGDAYADLYEYREVSHG